METTVKKVIEYLERIEKVKNNLMESGDLIGNNNISHGLSKDDCEFASNVLANEINRVYNISINI